MSLWWTVVRRVFMTSLTACVSSVCHSTSEQCFMLFYHFNYCLWWCYICHLIEGLCTYVSVWFDCSFLSQQLGKEFDRVAEALLPSLIQLMPNSAKIMSTSGTTAIRFIVRVSHSVFTCKHRPVSCSHTDDILAAFFFNGPGQAVLFRRPAWPRPGPSRSFSRPRPARAAQSWPGRWLRPL